MCTPIRSVWLASRSGRFTPEELAPSAQWFRSWVGYRTVCTVRREQDAGVEREVKSGSAASKKKNSPTTHVSRRSGGGGERMYSSYSFTNSALDGGEWSASRLT
jgi:hypothetical protein